MSSFPGETLKARIERGPLPLARALDVAVQISSGLAAAHRRGIVHGDVKPGNILVSPGERVKVVDFGIGQLEEAPGATPYRSPEQLRGEPVDARSDIWSLGAVLFEMLTGKGLFQDDSDREPVQRILEDAPLPLAERLIRVPLAVQRIVERALAKSPNARYATIEEMSADLLAIDTTGIPDDVAPALDETVTNVQLAAGPPRLSGRTVSHFRIGEPLGSGGMGVVYQAEDTRLGRPVALKFLAPERVRDPAAKVRFFTEARAASALDHSNLCTILEVGESEDGLLFLAMPRYDGESLERRIARGPMPVEQALDLAVQAASGLAKAHQHGIIHRDVKPDNLFVTRDGVVKILDFGIAKLAGEVGPTRAGTALGTPSYMAPEQMRGEPVDARADVWSLGVVLYEMLAGRRPFVGGTGAAVVHSVLHDAPEPLTHLRPELPAELHRVLSRMLAKDPEQRYANAAEALAGLRSALGQPVSGSLSPPAVSRPARRRLALAAPGALVLAAGA